MSNRLIQANIKKKDMYKQMKDIILFELEYNLSHTPYSLSKIIPNSSTGIKRYLDELLKEGEVSLKQVIENNRVKNIYTIIEKKMIMK